MRFSHKHICTSLLVLLFVLQGFTVALADRFYMAPNGSNTAGDGSRGNPYLTLSWIADNVLTPNTGDTVMVMSGTYPGETDFIGYSSYVRGHPDAFLTIMADPLGETKPVIDADDLTSACWSFYRYYQWPAPDLPQYDVAYVKIKGISFTNSYGHNINITDGGEYSRTYPAHHIIFEDCDFSDPGPTSQCLKMAGVDTFLIKDCTFSGATWAMLDLVGCHYGTVAGCSFSNDPAPPSGGAAIHVKGGSKSVTIDKCYFNNIGYSGICIGQTTGVDYFRPPFYTNDGDGNLCDYEAKDVDIYRSIFVNIVNPICFASSRGGGVYNCTFYSPTAYGVPTGVAYMFKMYSYHTSVGGYELVWPRDGEVINNVVVHMGSYGSQNTVVWTQSSTTLPETFLFSHNLWHNLEDPGTIPGWDLLATLYGSPQHDNDFTGNPMFAGGSNPELPEHFQLTEGSPAATAGTEPSYQIYDWFNGRYLQDLDYNNHAWSSPRSLGAFGMTVSGAPLSGPDVHRRLQPAGQ